MNIVYAFFTGVFLRLIVPIMVTALIVYFLRKLDTRWQAEAEKERQVLVKDGAPCWKEQGLSMDDVKLHAQKGAQPCWQAHRLSNGYLREACLDCEVFLDAPIPTSKSSHARL